MEDYPSDEEIEEYRRQEELGMDPSSYMDPVRLAEAYGAGPAGLDDNDISGSVRPKEKRLP
jgi:hypothetical protein